MTNIADGLLALLPVLILTGGSLACLLLEVIRGGRRLAAPVSIVTVVAAALALALIGQSPGDGAGKGMLAEVGTDLLALGMSPAIFLGALGALILGRRGLLRSGRYRAEFECLVLASTAGALVLAQARDLLMLFLGLETLSIPLYVLAGFVTDKPRPVESALKYFTVGAFSSAFVAFGSALVYGCGGTLSFSGAREAIAAAVSSGDTSVLLLARGGLAFLLVGFGFKIAAVPFHAWAPDVYQGAPTPVTTFLGVASKAAGMAGLLRLLVEVFPPLPEWKAAVAGLAVLTLVVGNCVAAVQEDMKRLLAYSGVAHVGYMLLGVVALGSAPPSAGGWTGGDPAVAAVVFYMGAYALMTLGAFAVVSLLEEEQGRDLLVVDFAGLSSRRPVLAFCMIVLLLSLGGMPPLAGFLGKLLVFLQAVRAGWAWLAVLGAATSVIGFFYYLRPVLQMYLRPSIEAERTRVPAAGTWLLVGLAVLGIVALGLAGMPVLRMLEGVPATGATVAMGQP